MEFLECMSDTAKGECGNGVPNFNPVPESASVHGIRGNTEANALIRIKDS